MTPFLTFALIVAGVAILIVFAGIKTVPQGQNWTVERFGRYTRTLDSGLRVIVPFIDRIGRKLSVMEQVLDVPEQTVITKDNAAVVADGVVFYRVDDTARAAYQVQNLEQAIVNLTTTNLRSVIGSMDLDDTLSKRAEINEILLAIIDEATNPWGAKIIRIEIRDLRMSDELQDAMNLQMTAERRRRASVTEANGLREAEILKAQGAREAEILRAQGCARPRSSRPKRASAPRKPTPRPPTWSRRPSRRATSRPSSSSSARNTSRRCRPSARRKTPSSCSCRWRRPASPAPSPASANCSGPWATRGQGRSETEPPR
jgi:regulator of protease activity HflC (stomatin/prohibitin superfamily)